MNLSLDRTLRLIWLAIGVLLLGALLVAVVLVIGGFLRTRGAPAAATAAVSGAEPDRSTVDLRLSLPEPVAGTETRIAFLGAAGAGHAPPGAAAGRRAGVANVAFLDPDGGARLLLDRSAHIREVRYPAPAAEAASPAEVTPTWITYEIALTDTDGDGRLGAADAAGLYVSGVDGRGLRPVMGSPRRILAHRALDAGTLLVYALEEGGAERAYLYDVTAGRLAPFTALDSVGVLARRLWRGEDP